MYMRLDHSSTVVTRFVLRVSSSLKMKNHESHFKFKLVNEIIKLNYCII